MHVAARHVHQRVDLDADLQRGGWPAHPGLGRQVCCMLAVAVGVGRVLTALGRGCCAARQAGDVGGDDDSGPFPRPGTVDLGSLTLRVDDALRQAIIALALRVGIETS